MQMQEMAVYKSSWLRVVSLSAFRSDDQLHPEEMDLSRFFPPSLIDHSFGLCISPQDLIYPSYNFHGTNYYRPWKWNMQTAEKDFGSTIQNEKDKFKIELDVQHFNPSEINVKVAEREVIIEGKHEERQDNHGFISRQFKRRYFLPHDCNADIVMSSLSSDGVLTVTADKIMKLKNKETIVPIKICDSCPNKNLKAKVEKNEITVEVIKKLDSKKGMEIVLKEDHCCLLKPELLGAPSTAGAEKITQAMKSEDNSLKTLTGTCEATTTKSSEKTEITAEQSSAVKSEKSESLSCGLLSASTTKKGESLATGSANVGKSEQSEKVACGITSELVTEKAETSAATTSEMCETQSSFNETIQIQESSTSSYSASMATSVKETTEKISELVSDLSAQLREAAENI